MTDIIVIGADGYTGWPITCKLLSEGYDVHGLDDLSGRNYRGESVVPITDHDRRAVIANKQFDGQYTYNTKFHLSDEPSIRAVLTDKLPQAVINVAQIPSAPYSMQDFKHAWRVQQNNIRGSLALYHAIHNCEHTTPHVIQLATMGEYGTPDRTIPEGFTKDGRPAPKDPGSLYHASKVNTTVNTLFLAETWGIPTTEVYQGIVYGVNTAATRQHPDLNTRFDIDEQFGTVVNRFTAQTAVGHPLTVYGHGGQKRAMLPLQDCVNCIHLLTETPPSVDYRAVNQFQGAERINELADYFAEHYDAAVKHYENPREEDDSEHYYEVDRDTLDQFGYDPSEEFTETIDRTLSTIENHTDRIETAQIEPETTWTEPHP